MFSRTADEMMTRVAIYSVAPIVLALLEAGPLAAQIAPSEGASPPDKSNYTMLNPTPDAELRDFCTDRPPKANLPCTVDAGHFQYESDVFNWTRSSSGGATTDTFLPGGRGRPSRDHPLRKGADWLAGESAAKRSKVARSPQFHSRCRRIRRREARPRLRPRLSRRLDAARWPAGRSSTAIRLCSRFDRLCPRTPKDAPDANLRLTYCFSVISGSFGTLMDGDVVPGGGIEPPTLRFSVACSTN